MASQPPGSTYSLPAPLSHTHATPAPRKSWQQRLNMLHSHTSSNNTNTHGNELHQPTTNASARSKHTPKWWKIRLFRGMINDVRRRAPYYWSDWTDAWDYRVVPATVYMYFAKWVCSILAFFVWAWCLWWDEMLMGFVVFCLLWRSRWICKSLCSWWGGYLLMIIGSRRRTWVLVLMRCCSRLCLARWFLLSLLLSRWSLWGLLVQLLCSTSKWHCFTLQDIYTDKS